MHEPVCQEVWPHCRAGLHSLLLPAPLQLVLHVLYEVCEGDAEYIFHEVSSKLQSLVGVVVLVVLRPQVQGEFQHRPCNSSEEDSLLEPRIRGVAEMGQEGAVDDRFHLLHPVVLCLARGKLLLQIVQCVLGGEYSAGGVLLAVLCILYISIYYICHLWLGDDGVVDVLIVIHAQRLHEHDKGDAAGGGDLHFQHSVLFLLHQGKCAVSLPLGEYLGHLHGCSVSFVALH